MSPWLEKLRDAIGSSVGRNVPQTMANSLVELAKATDVRFSQLEARLAAQEARSPSLDYLGTFQQGKHYTRGCGVTFGGSLWVAVCDTHGVPGRCDDWQLAVKRGRDGRDAKDDR